MTKLFEENDNLLLFSPKSITALDNIEHAGDGINLNVAFEKKNNWKIYPGWENIKHSDDPNCKVVERDWHDSSRYGRSDDYKSYYIYTIRYIKKDEEITIDFNTIPEELAETLRQVRGIDISDDEIIGDDNNSISNKDESALEYYREDNKLSSKERKQIPDKLFGLPKQRKYPLHDEEHVRKAIQFFTYCKEEDRKELAKNIKRRMKDLDLDIKISENNPLYKYISESFNSIWNHIHNGHKIKYIEESLINSIEEVDLTMYIMNNDILNEGNGAVFTLNDVIAEFDIPYEGEGINLHIAFEKRKYWKFRKGWENVRHSQDPNCRVVKQEWLDNPKDRNKVISYFVVTTKDIKKGESITIDYSTLPTELRNKLIQKHFNDLDFMDIYDIEYSSFTESSNKSKDDIVPVYVILTSTGSTMAKVIQKFTKTIYNHASIAFDIDLSRMYSFGVGDDDKLGFALESRTNTYLRKFEDVKCQVYSVFIKKDQADKMKLKLDEFIAMKDKFRYNFLGLIGYLLKKPIKKNYAMFCSEFVDSMFKLINIDLTNKDSSLVEPYDFARSKSKRIYKLYEGPMKLYEPDKVKRVMNNMKKKYLPIVESVIYEVKEFPVQFDKEGNLLIKNFKKIDYEHEYAKSHKLLIAYDESDNYEGMKYELSKLWFMNSLLEKSIYDNKTNSDKKKEYIKVRARILNDFNKYLKLLSKIDKSFNFTEYYDNTPFSDAIIRINKDTITGVGKLIKKLII